jgi:hypothetical protein
MISSDTKRDAPGKQQEPKTRASPAATGSRNESPPSMFELQREETQGDFRDADLPSKNTKADLI